MTPIAAGTARSTGTLAASRAAGEGLRSTESIARAAWSETATAAELYHNPRHPYTLGLLRSVPRLDQIRKEKLDPIEGMPPDLIHMDSGCPFRPRCRFAVERCKTENPPLISVADAHSAACWEWERVGKEPAESAA